MGLRVAPAMTLMEMLVGLAILGLVMGFALAVLGPWLLEGRRAEQEAAFERSIEPAQLILAELAAGAVDPDETFSVEASRARLRVYIPRLSSQPFDVDLAIVDAPDGKRALAVRSTGLAQANLLESPAPLRFRTTDSAAGARAIVLETRRVRAWRPLLVAEIAANAPLRCEFDFISRTCRQ